MTTDHTRCRSSLRLIGVAIGVALSSGLFVQAAASADAAPAAPAKPQLSIAIDDGRTSTKPGDALAYTISIHNTGSSAVRTLTVTQTIPAGLSFKSADAGGVVKADAVHWTINIAVGGTGAMHTSMDVTTTPPSLLRLATVACATTSVKGPPIVCASHSDQLPAGAFAAAQQRHASPAGSSISSHVGWYVGIGGTAVLLAGFLVLRHRRRIAGLAGTRPAA